MIRIRHKTLRVDSRATSTFHEPLLWQRFCFRRKAVQQWL